MAVAVTADSRVLIIGAGCFGLSTAYHLLKRGYKNITILDRSPSVPAPDAASTDINKIVRSSYSDIFYARLAREAIEAWKDRDEWSDTYHECGVVVVGASKAAYTDNSFTNDIALGARTEILSNPETIRALFPEGVRTGSFQGISGYINRDGGWAFAAQGISLLMEKVKSLGGQIVPGKWQSVAFIQLTQEEADRYRNCPVYLDFISGFYIFPPNSQNIVKMAIHSNGHTFKDPSTGVAVSSPRTSLSHGDDGLRIPKKVAQTIRNNLRMVYPELGEKPFSGTRLCWYTDTPDDDWIIGYHPTDSGLVLATGGSGHAYKFLPNIGRLVADAIENKLEPDLVQRFALNREHNQHHVSRTGPQAQELDVTDLIIPGDLLP
ncbi:hypothetical protein NLI96_g11721 [Meripilus lineatus]|uniref:FAD dependent oxidoreductase domain-containing protein n=1 Tax=Meripilus lineatus TaxID=2056292 RepID=A0AAD5USN9_9APHY|nr:hypothetical protein NLI96_g11721 [Physisporinus lineatus]